MMKVLNIHNKYRTLTGEDFAAEEFAEALKGSAKIQVSEYCLSSKDFLRYAPAKKIFGLLKGNIPYYRPADFRRLIRREKPDVAFIHNLIPLINVWILKELKENNVPVVCLLHNFRLFCPQGNCFRNNAFCVDCHEKSLLFCIAHNCMNSFFLSFVFSWRVFLFRKFVPYIHTFAAPSEFVEEFYRKRLKDIHIIQHKEFVSLPPRALEKRPEKKGYVIFVGRIVEDKGIRAVLSAAKEMSDVHFKICGDGPLLEYGRTFVLRHTMRNVEFLGPKEREDVMDLIASALVLLVPSLSNEAWARVTTEAMLLGTPVLGRIPCAEGMTPAVLEPESPPVPLQLINRLKEAFGYAGCRHISVPSADLKKISDRGAYKEYFLETFGCLKSG